MSPPASKEFATVGPPSAPQLTHRRQLEVLAAAKAVEWRKGPPVFFLAGAARNVRDLFDLRLQLLREVHDLLANVDLQRIIEISAKINDPRASCPLIIRIPHLMPAAPFDQAVVAINEQALCFVALPVKTNEI